VIHDNIDPLGEPLVSTVQERVGFADGWRVAYEEGELSPCSYGVACHRLILSPVAPYLVPACVDIVAKAINDSGRR
jgi:hypothetical protein